MELHEYFMNVTELQPSIFEIIGSATNLRDSIDSVAIKFVEDCFEKLKTEDDIKKHLDLLRLSLCYQYKLNYNENKENKTRFHSKCHQFIEFLTQSKFYKATEYQSIFYDIIILQLILFENQKNFIRLFEDFRTSSIDSQQQTNSNFSTDWYLKILNCFLQAWQILYFLCDTKDLGVANKTHLESCKKVLMSSIMYDLQSWIQCKENNDWLALHSVVSKIINITKNVKILSPYAHEILDKKFALTTLCILCDLIFPFNYSNIDMDYTLILTTKLWSCIENKLESQESLDRKEALHLFKRLTEFIDTNEENIKKAMSLNLLPNRLNPFICNENDKSGLKQIITNFILIMEALEEKQKHLVIPTLSLVDSLVDGCMKHKSCGDCFNSTWICCIFKRILNHDNNAVVKWGLLKALQMNAEMYKDQSLIVLIVRSLNNTFLYEKNNDENQPEVVIALMTWFYNCQREDLPLIEIFVNYLHYTSWGPVAIFYVLQSLYLVSDKLENIVNWKQEQLDMVKVLVESNIKLHPPMLRSMSQVTLIKIISRYSEIHSLTTISQLLSVFSEKDLRNDCCWPVLTSWLAKVPYNNAVNFIRLICKDLAVDNKKLDIPMSILALVIQLLYEGGVICQTNDCTVTQELRTLLFCLDKADVRPYVKTSLVIESINLFYSLFSLKRQSPEFIYKILITYKETIFKFILKLFHNENFCYEDIKVCTKVLQSLECHVNCRVNKVSVITSFDCKDLEIKCVQVLSNANQYNKVQLLFALEMWSNISNHYKYENNYFLSKIKDLLKISQEQNNEFTGKMGSDYYTALSRLIKNHVQTLNSDGLKRNDEMFQVLSNILDAAGNQVLIYFSDIVYPYSAAFIDDDKKLDNLKFLIKSFWSYNFGSKRDKTFWLVTQKLTENINNHNFINSKCLQEISQEFTDRMLYEGDSLPCLKYILLTCSKMNGHFNFFMEIILNGLLHGQVMRRDQRITLQTHVMGKKMLPDSLKVHESENFKVYEFINRQCNMDASIRAAAVVKLSTALLKNKENASLILPLVLENLSTIQNKRYYADSQLHRLKHRIMQILLLLQPHLDQESTKILYNALRDSMIRDTDQHSVRMMKEWLLIKIYLENQNLLSDFWLFFDTICDERPGVVSSVIGIIWHIAQHLPKENLIQFLETALGKLGFCCMGQQFGMRLFGQVFFVKLYDLLNDNCDIRIEYKQFYDTSVKSLNSGNFKKNPIKIDQDFFYTVFNPIEHYSLETIYHQLPRLSNMSFEEWIIKENFEDQISINNAIISLKVKNSNDLLDKAVVPYSILKSNENSKSEEIEYSEITTDIQKKITPWKAMLPNKELELTDFSDTKIKVENKQDIIVVASLIDKPQNLGGIARTCEIFRVKELVVSNLKQIEDKEFQVLSVSADRWIKIIEVKTFSLVKYLLELKENGWTLIGAEQTVNSVNLFDFKFPKQTVLILGNESNGIPANIIPLLDICVEIPQYGVTRSLNVHVTSAICIWEYVKQYQF